MGTTALDLASVQDLEKVLDIAPYQLTPATDATSFEFTGGPLLRPNSSGSTEAYFGTVVPPIGVLVTHSAAQLHRGTASNSATARFVTAAGGTLATLSRGSTARPWRPPPSRTP